jgi:hypothetical protein
MVVDMYVHCVHPRHLIHLTCTANTPPQSDHPFSATNTTTARDWALITVVLAG